MNLFEWKHLTQFRFGKNKVRLEFSKCEELILIFSRSQNFLNLSHLNFKHFDETWRACFWIDLLRKKASLNVRTLINMMSCHHSRKFERAYSSFLMCQWDLFHISLGFFQNSFSLLQIRRIWPFSWEIKGKKNLEKNIFLKFLWKIF